MSYLISVRRRKYDTLRSCDLSVVWFVIVSIVSRCLSKIEAGNLLPITYWHLESLRLDGRSNLIEFVLGMTFHVAVAPRYGLTFYETIHRRYLDGFSSVLPQICYTVTYSKVDWQLSGHRQRYFLLHQLTERSELSTHSHSHEWPTRHWFPQ